MQNLIQAHEAYVAAMAAFEAAHPFDLATMMDRPEPPQQSAEAEAGQMIAEFGLERARSRALFMGSTLGMNERQQRVAELLALADAE